jgi:hypothetical protein
MGRAARLVGGLASQSIARNSADPRLVMRPYALRRIFGDGPANAYIHSANRVSPLSRPSARAEIAAARPKIPV